MKAKVLSVYDDGAVEDRPLIGAKGLAIFIDVDGQKTLFDTGMRGRYLVQNMDHLDIDINSIDRVVLSHNHKSNIGGLSKLLEERKEPLDVFVNQSFSSMHRLFGRSFISEENQSKIIVHEMLSDTQFSDHLSALGPFGGDEEFFLVMKTESGPVVFSSCYHCGTAQVMAAVKEKYKRNPACLVGGIHLPKVKQKDVDPTAEILKQYGSPNMYLGHCAGPLGITFLRVHFTLSGVKDFYAGTEMQFEV